MNAWVAGHVIYPLHERLMGRKTFACYRQLMQSQWWPAERLRQLQLDKLRARVAAAMKTPAYAELTGLPSGWLPQSLDDLGRLPLVDKALLDRHREELVDHSVPGGAISYATGGSSGEPLRFYLDRRRQGCDKAARMRTHEWFGHHVGDREAYIWGSPVELRGQDRLKSLRDRLTNELLLSAFELSPASVDTFLDRLAAFRPRCLFGYPSSIALLCRLAAERGLAMPPLPLAAAFTTAEVLYEDQRKLIEQTFNVPLADGYGSREGGFISHQCPRGRMHITSENVIVEFLRDGRAAAPGQDGEIVVTHLDNYAMPFIRYRTGDIGQASDEACPCGRTLGVMKVVSGRTTDFIIAPDGRWVHGLALIYAVRDLPGVRQYQIRQESLQQIVVRLVAGEAFPPDGEAKIVSGIVKRLGPGLSVLIERVDSIAPEASGKFRFVISAVARQRHF